MQEFHKIWFIKALDRLKHFQALFEFQLLFMFFNVFFISINVDWKKIKRTCSNKIWGNSQSSRFSSQQQISEALVKIKIRGKAQHNAWENNSQTIKRESSSMRFTNYTRLLLSICLIFRWLITFPPRFAAFPTFFRRYSPTFERAVTCWIKFVTNLSSIAIEPKILNLVRESASPWSTLITHKVYLNGVNRY